MRKRKKSYAKADLAYLSRFMGALFPDQKRLGEIQAAYDNLTLLGQLLGAGTDITRMRQDFQELASVLLDQLAMEHYKKATLNLSSCARVAIDVLTRNLYERTADIGFLATDNQICAFAEAVEADVAVRHDPAWRDALRGHFSEYVAKYSVYHDIILLSPDGDVLARLDDGNPVVRTVDKLLGEALRSSAGYVEAFRPVDLLPGCGSPLIYAYRVMSRDGSHPVGVLCLCFRFQDECKRIFDSLISEDDWTVVTLLDAGGNIIASSDPYQFPVGAHIEPVRSDECEIRRFAGREYLASTRPADPYQGYSGPGWLGHVMAPLNHAFEMSEAQELADIAKDTLSGVLDVATLFSQELRAIPIKAESIQQELNRAVWNGNIWLARDGDTRNADFAKVLLREIGSTGIRTRNVFSESTTNLYKTVVSSVLFDCGSQAALAIDIMDRNLYERANDCRWWALTELFRSELAAPRLGDAGQRERLTEVLRHINALYTVYSNLILFDASGRVVAVSNPAYNDSIGKSLDESWVRPTLGLRDAQSYCVSSFAASDVYGGEATYVFTAGIHAPRSREPVGGIAIVFDSTSQFKAMLHDVLPRQKDGSVLPGAFAVFAECDGKVISSTNARLAPGSRIAIGREFFDLERGECRANVVVHDGVYCAVGSCMSAGYREYKSPEDSYQEDVVALIFTPLSDRVLTAEETAARRAANAERYVLKPARGTHTVDIASFYIGRNWYGVQPGAVVAAVDTDRLTPMPGSPEWVAGCMMYDDRAITVFDISTTLIPDRPGHERRRFGAAGKPQILVMKSSTHEARFGILVDNLGEIAEISADRIEELPKMLADGQSMIESLVKPLPEEEERRILIVLAVDKIVQRFSPPGLGSASAEGRPVWNERAAWPTASDGLPVRAS